MATKPKKMRGDVVAGDEPNWDPLERAVAQWLPGQFMATHQIRLTNGRRLYAYKHIETRRYLHIDADLNAYRYGHDNRSHRAFYDPISLDEAFALVLLHPEFETGWIEGCRFSRPPGFDEDGFEIEDDDDRYGFFSYYEERMALERWQKLRAPFEEFSGVPGGE
ncbi:MAG: hypothetical protein ACJ762_14490 [Solirubrobacteraceae bacterium]